MIKIGILGDIGSGKSYIAKNFGYPVFNADLEVSKLYRSDKKIFSKLKKNLPKYIYSFPVNKSEITEAILNNKSYSVFNFSKEGKPESTITDKEYLEYVKKAKDHCKRGDVFQLVLSRRLCGRL